MNDLWFATRSPFVVLLQLPNHYSPLYRFTLVLPLPSSTCCVRFYVRPKLSPWNEHCFRRTRRNRIHQRVSIAIGGHVSGCVKLWQPQLCATCVRVCVCVWWWFCTIETKPPGGAIFCVRKKKIVHISIFGPLGWEANTRVCGGYNIQAGLSQGVWI